MPRNMATKHGRGDTLDQCEERIKQLYPSSTLRQLKATIDLEFGQNVPESQYRKKIKQLGLRKYRKGSETAVLSSILARMPRGSEVLLWGTPLSQHEVERIRSRGRPSIFERLGSHQLPRGYTVRLPAPERTEDSTGNFPFLEFSQALCILFADSTHTDLWSTGISPRLLQDTANTIRAESEYTIEGGNLIPLSLNGTQASGNAFFANNPHVLKVLENVPPPLGIYDCISGSSASPNSRMVNLFLGRQLLFSIANGFAGIDGFPIWQPFKLLQGISVQVLGQLFQLTQGPTIRAIAQSLFKASIESGSHIIVNAILSYEVAYIDVNKEKIFENGHAYTPMERASMLRHHATIDVLLCHRADLDKTYSPASNFPRGALECAVHRYHGPNDETFQLLTSRTPAVSSTLLWEIAHNERCFMHLIKHHSRKCKSLNEASTRLGLVTYAVKSFSEQGVLDVLEFLGSPEVQPDLLNRAADRGYAKLYQKLASEYGLRPDGDTLFASIAGGNMHLVQSLLSCEPSIHRLQDNQFRITPLVVAINRGNKEIIDLLRCHGAFSCFPSWGVFLAAWHAAKKAQNKELLEEMMGINPEITDQYESINWALRAACRTGDYEWAQKLLGRRASSNGAPLRAAIRSQDMRLVDLFLDFGAYIRSKDLTLAAEIGDCSVVRALLAEGVEPERDALHTALRRKDKKLADLFLDAGVDINGVEKSPRAIAGPHNPEPEASALQVTAELGDLDLVEYVLGKGADPNDWKALIFAHRTNPTISKSILTAYTERYNRRMKGFGSAILVLAIDGRDLALVRILLEHNVDPHDFLEHRRRRDGSKDLYFALNNIVLIGGDTDGDRLTNSYDKKVTPFGYAILTGDGDNLDVVTEFLSAHCYPSEVVSLTYTSKSVGESRTTAFLAAVETENVQLIQLLIQKDENIIHAPARRKARRTALQRAAEIGSLKMVKFLHNLGANINEPPNRDSGATALQLAAIGGFGQIVCYLIDHGANVNAPGALINGMTALVGAASRGRIDIVAILLNKGAGRGEDGCKQFEMALKEAEEYGHYPTYDYLIQRWNAQRQEDSPPEHPSLESFIDMDACTDE